MIDHCTGRAVSSALFCRGKEENTVEIRLLDSSYRGKELYFHYWTEAYYDISLRETDSGFLCKWERREFSAPVEKSFTDTLLSDWLEEPRLYGALWEGKIVGYLELSHERWNNRLRISNIWVSEDCRRRGVGTSLMNRAIQTAEEVGARSLILETQSCNEPAIRFYRRNGFSLIGFDLTAYSQEDMQKKEVRLEMGRSIDGQTKMECGRRAVCTSQKEE